MNKKEHTITGDIKIKSEIWEYTVYLNDISINIDKCKVVIKSPVNEIFTVEGRCLFNINKGVLLNMFSRQNIEKYIKRLIVKKNLMLL
jgi:hypothetical protein